MYSLSIRSKGLGLPHIDMRALYIRRDCFHAACQPPTYPTPSASSLREQRFVCILQQQRNMYHGDFTIIEPPYRESTVAIDINFFIFLSDDEDHFLTHDAIGFLYFVLGSGSSESLLPSPLSLSERSSVPWVGACAWMRAISVCRLRLFLLLILNASSSTIAMVLVCLVWYMVQCSATM